MLDDDKIKHPTFVSSLKETDMRTKIGLVLGLLVAFSTISLEAQSPKPNGCKRAQMEKDSVSCRRGELRGCCGLYKLPNVTESQKAEFKKVEEVFNQEVVSFRSKANELKGKIKDQISEGNEVISDLANNITELNSIRTKIELAKAKEVMSFKALLTPEQKTMFNDNLRKIGDRNHFKHMDRRNHQGEKGVGKEAGIVDNGDNDDDLID